jgi:hypothetical protein
MIATDVLFDRDQSSRLDQEAWLGGSGHGSSARMGATMRSSSAGYTLISSKEILEAACTTDLGLHSCRYRMESMQVGIGQMGMLTVLTDEPQAALDRVDG